MTKLAKNMYIIIGLAALIIGFLIGNIVFRSDAEVKYVNKLTVRIDTLETFVELPVKNIYIKSKAKVEYINTTDTVIVTTRPFIASIDTVVKRDSIYTSYEFPKNEFVFDLRQAPDSIKVETIKIFQEREREKEWHEATWFRIGTHVAAVVFTAYVMKK